MDKVKDLLAKVTNSKALILAGAVGIMVLAGAAYMHSGKAADTETTRSYTIPEKQLAIDVKDYLGKYVLIEDEESEKIAETAVDAYDKIIDSNVSTITNEHIEALEDSIGLVLNDFLEDEDISNEDKLALSSGIAQIILNSLLEQIEGSKYSYDPEFEEQYMSLADSLQAQIDDLNNRTYQFKINASIEKSDQSGLSEEDKDNIEEKLEDLREELQEEMKDIEDGEDGKDGKDGKDGVGIAGKDGKNGIDGKDGKDGTNGKDGQDGKSTYMFFADDEKGTNFSQTLTSNSKFVATITTNKAPETITKSDLSGKWEKWRDLSMTAVTDENGKTTIVLK